MENTTHRKQERAVLFLRKEIQYACVYKLRNPWQFLYFLRVFCSSIETQVLDTETGKALVSFYCPTLLFLSSSFFPFSSFPASTISLSSLSPPFSFVLLTHLLSLCPLSPLSSLSLSLLILQFTPSFPICLLLCTAGGICEFGVLHPSLCEVSVTPVQRAISAGPRATTPGRERGGREGGREGV